MAYKVATTSELKMVASFADGDTRTIAIDNPKENITLSQISEVATKAVGILTGDKSGAAFVSFSTPKYVETTNIYLDLTP